MNKLVILLIAVLGILTTSCKKDSEEPVITPKADYYQLKVGNYWIYEGFELDSNGVATSTGKFDSAYIEKDTVIRGFTYKKLLENRFLFRMQWPSYLRDSSGYLVTSNGFIMASDDNFTKILSVDTAHPELYTATVQMTGKDSLVTIPAGTIQSITSRQTVVPAPPNIEQFPIRYTYDIYGKGVGRIKSHSFFYTGNLQFESRLVRYKVN